MQTKYYWLSIKQWCLENCSDDASFWNQGIIQGRIKDVGLFNLTDTNFYSIYEISDGQVSGIKCIPFLAFRLLSIAEVVSTYDYLQEIYSDYELIEGLEDKSDFAFNTLWLPFATDDTGNFLGIDYSQKRDEEVGKVILFGSDVAYTIISESLLIFLNRIYENINSNMIYFDKDEECCFWKDGKIYHLYDLIKINRNIFFSGGINE